MANWNEPRPDLTGFGASPSLDGRTAGRAGYDMGLRKHMLSIYNYMASGVLLSGIVALLTASSGTTQAMIGSPLMFVVMLSPLAIVFAMSFGANRFSAGTLQLLFWAFAALMGVSLSTIFLVYTGGSIAATFFATAGAFAGLSLFGYTTKKDLTGFGSFLIMGVVGLLIASLLNIWLQSPGLYWAVSFLGVLIFAGLTAFYTQEIKTTYIAHAVHGDQEWLDKAAIDGALSLYISFLNMFQFLLMFMGQQQE